MIEIREIASGLRFPEGPIAMPDGSIVLVEIAAGALTRIDPKGGKHVIAKLGGGPNGAAIGPDGKCYVCNNGGFRWTERDGRLFPGMAAEDYTGGRIERVDLATGKFETLYDKCNGVPLKGPNDIVFDAQGGFWFTDLGKMRLRDRDRGGVYYARSDGSSIEEVIFPLDTPNGIGLSPDERRVYVAETGPGRLWAFELAGPGRLAKTVTSNLPNRGKLVIGLPDFQLFDSLAVERDGNVCVATLYNGCITVAAPQGGLVEQVAMPEPMTTNICYGGVDLRTAYITLSSTGRLVAVDWPRPGLPLNFVNR